MNDKLTSALYKQLELTEDKIKIFEYLSESGKASVSDVSKATEIKRTTCYRFIEDMERKGLVEKIIEDGTTYYKLISFENIKLLVSQKKEEIDTLMGSLPELKTQLFSPEVMASSEIQVKVYRTVAGIKQLMWNTLMAKKYYYGMYHNSLISKIGAKFLEKWIEELNSREIEYKAIGNKEGYDKDLVTYPELKKIRAKYDKTIFEGRYCPEKLMKIKHQVDIYDNTLAFYNIEEKEIYGIEIRSKQVTQTYRQFFLILWEQLGEHKMVF